MNIYFGLKAKIFILIFFTTALLSSFYFQKVSSASEESLEKLVQDVETNDVRENRDIGFGAKRVYLQNRGYWITAIAFENRIIGLEVLCLGSGPDKSVEPTIKKAIVNAELPSWDSDVCYYHYVDDEGFKLLQTKIESELGASEKSLIKDLQNKELYENLNSPFSKITVGTACGYAGSKPAGRVAVENLVNAKRIDVLRSLLRSPNPESRVYAAIGLKTLAKNDQKLLSADDLDAIEKVKNLPIEISSCGGCLPLSQTAAQLIE